MAAARKKRAKPRASAKARKSASVVADLKELDSEWHAFITEAAHQKPLSTAWPDPQGTPAKKAKKKMPARKMPRSAGKKSVRKKASRK
jgi:hypothetical protein